MTDSAWSETDWTLKRAIRTGRFWALMIFPFCVIIDVYIVIVHSVRFLVDTGIDKMTAAFILAFSRIISSGFWIFWRWLSDRIGREKTYTLGILCITMGLCSLVFLQILGGECFAYTFIGFFGGGWGVTAPMFMAAAADLFQGRSIGLIYGIVEASIGIGAAFGPCVAGFIFDKTQSYQWAFVLAASFSIVSCIFVWLAARRKLRRKEKIRTIEAD